MIVITLFKKRKKQGSKPVSFEKKDIVQDSEILPGDISNRLKKIEEALEALSKRPVEYVYKIDKVDIHNPILKELTFSLDKLDIKDLSGALNLGNNFGISVDKDGREKQKGQKDVSKQKDSVTIKFDEDQKPLNLGPTIGK